MSAISTRQDAAGAVEPAAVDTQARNAVKRLQGTLGRAIDLLSPLSYGEVDSDIGGAVYGVEVAVGRSERWTVPLGSQVAVVPGIGTLVRYHGALHILIEREGEVFEVHGMPEPVVTYLERRYLAVPH